MIDPDMIRRGVASALSETLPVTPEEWESIGAAFRRGWDAAGPPSLVGSRVETDGKVYVVMAFIPPESDEKSSWLLLKAPSGRLVERRIDVCRIVGRSEP